jgi:phage terminase large subunit-like protein
MTTACPDWEARIKSGQSLLPEPLFPERADLGEKFFGHLKLTDVAGHPRLRDSSLPWTMDLVRNIFGAYDDEKNKQLIREFFVLISKKNSKSTTSAGIMLTALLLNQRTNAELVILAPTVEIARNAYDPLRGMIKEEPELSDLFRVQDHIRTITHRLTGATLKVIAADSDTVGGLKASFILVDELWLFGKRRNAENMLREATGGLVSRPEGFVVYLTTQSDEPPAGVFKDKLNYARKVRDGSIKDSQFLPLLYEFPEEMVKNEDWRNPDNWFITNPNIGASVDVDYLKREYAKAEQSGEQSMRGFAAKHLNVEIGIALSNDNWAGAEFWEQCGAGLTLDQLIFKSEVCVVGIDGGGLDDLLGITIAGRDKETGRWLYWSHAYAHKIVLDRRKDIAERLLDFESEGHLTIVQSPGDDVVYVCELIAQVRDAELLPNENAIGVDAAGIGSIVEELTGDSYGMTMSEIVAIGQGWKLNGAIKTLERKLAAKEVEHCGSDMMNWVVGNARVVPVGNAIRIDKQVSGSAKIDPLMSALNATQLLMLNPAARKKKYQMFFV